MYICPPTRPSNLILMGGIPSQQKYIYFAAPLGLQRENVSKDSDENNIGHTSKCNTTAGVGDVSVAQYKDMCDTRT